MTVVAIVGVLAAVGVILVTKHFRASKGLEATSIIQSIRVAQEARRAEVGSYLNVSQQDVWYPAAPDGKTKTAWVAAVAPPADTDAARWRELGVAQTDGTSFGFKTWAGNPGPVTGFNLGLPSAPVFADSPDVWYMIEAAGDVDADGSYWRIWASSFDGEVSMVNEGE
jgi:type II secretory pathway pseudopilin PulG